MREYGSFGSVKMNQSAEKEEFIIISTFNKIRLTNERTMVSAAPTFIFIHICQQSLIRNYEGLRLHG